MPVQERKKRKHIEEKAALLSPALHAGESPPRRGKGTIELGKTGRRHERKPLGGTTYVQRGASRGGPSDHPYETIGESISCTTGRIVPLRQG